MLSLGSGEPKDAEGDDSGYVEAWLGRVRRDSALPTPRGSLDPRASPEVARPIWRPHLLPVQDPTTTSRGLRQRSPSLFVRDSPIPSLPSEPSSLRYSPADAPQGASANRSHDRERGEHIVTASVQPTDDSFRKKPRRKTRRDRCDTKKGTGNDVVERGLSDAKRKRAKTTKQGLRSSREVVNNFSSDSVSTKRVTVRTRRCSSVTLGLT